MSKKLVDPSEEIIENCTECKKPPTLCQCAEIKAVANSHCVLILQHPQEPDKLLGSAYIAKCSLENATLRVGLSWPNLTKALGRSPVDPKNWGVLFLGSKNKGQKNAHILQVVDKKGAPVASSAQALKSLEGIVVLDGTWSQAKALWWRNPWLLKLKRLVLSPPREKRSLYAKIRREPRPECLSTIESIAETLTALGESSKVSENLMGSFQELLKRYQANHSKG